MNWMPIVAVSVAWLIATLFVLSIRGKSPSRRFGILIVLCSSVSAGTAQYFVSMGIRQTERLSAARLVGVSCLRLKDDAEFVHGYLLTRISPGEGDHGDAAPIDWTGTFQMKAEDIATTFAAVERNPFIRNNYSVWMADIEFHHDQLDRLANHVVTIHEETPRQSAVETYVKGVELAADQLDRLAVEMRFRRPEAYYE